MTRRNRKVYTPVKNGVSGSHAAAPVIKLEMMRGRISIFSILIRMSPGKAITMTISGWIGEATRSSIPDTAPRITPKVQGGQLGFMVEKESGACFWRKDLDIAPAV